MKEQVDKYQLSVVGKIIARYREELLFFSPPEEVVRKFLDECPYDTRLATIRRSLENYLNGETDIILDV